MFAPDLRVTITRCVDALDEAMEALDIELSRRKYAELLAELVMQSCETSSVPDARSLVRLVAA